MIAILSRYLTARRLSRGLFREVRSVRVRCAAPLVYRRLLASLLFSWPGVFVAAIVTRSVVFLGLQSVSRLVKNQVYVDFERRVEGTVELLGLCLYYGFY